MLKPTMICENGKLRVETVVVFTFFSVLLIDSVYTNLIIYRTCYIILGYNQSECALLGSQVKDNQTAKLEKLVEPHASVISMARSITEGLCTALICSFIGPWSDKFGRKPLILFPIIGFSISLAGVAIYSLLPNLSPWYTILCTIPVILSGGLATFLTGTLSYITDITTEETRGIRIGVFEAVLGLGVFLGNISSSYVFYATSYHTIFLISAGTLIILAILVQIFLPESLENRKTEGHVREFFQISNLIDMVKCSFKKREHYNRAIILTSLLQLSLYITVINGDMSVVFLYLRNKFQWSLEHYTLYSSAGNIIFFVGTIFGIYILHKLLKVTEIVMILLGYMSLMSGHLVQALATNNAHIYLGCIIKLLGGVMSPMTRSIVSKLVPIEDIGKVFSLIVIAESIIGMMGSPVYVGIYNNTINTQPAAFMFVTVGLFVIEILLTMVIMLLFWIKSSQTSSLLSVINDDKEVLIENPEESFI